MVIVSKSFIKAVYYLNVQIYPFGNFAEIRFREGYCTIKWWRVIICRATHDNTIPVISNLDLRISVDTFTFTLHADTM